jgi:hypothetical protein
LTSRPNGHLAERACEHVPASAAASLSLAGKVVVSGANAHLMNVPAHKPNWPVAAVERGLMPLRYARFVSPMVHRGAIDATACPSSTT